jgi:penicillin-binding protein 2
VDIYSKRKYLLNAIFCLAALAMIVRLFYIQASSKISTAGNVLRRQINYLARGLAYDRNHTLIVYNQAAYDVLKFYNSHIINTYV